jgi:hypothetical protein
VIVVAELELFCELVPRAKEGTILRAFHYDVFFLFYFFCYRRGLRKLISQSQVLICGELPVRLFIGFLSMDVFCHFALKRNN